MKETVVESGKVEAAPSRDQAWKNTGLAGYHGERAGCAGTKDEIFLLKIGHGVRTEESDADALDGQGAGSCIDAASV